MSQPARFKSKDVLDADHAIIGTVIGSELSDGTREPTSLLVELEPETRELFGGKETIWLAYDRVREIRRGELTLDDSLQDLVEAHPSEPTLFSATPMSEASRLAREAAEA